MFSDVYIQKESVVKIFELLESRLQLVENKIKSNKNKKFDKA